MMSLSATRSNGKPSNYIEVSGSFKSLDGRVTVNFNLDTENRIMSIRQTTPPNSFCIEHNNSILVNSGVIRKILRFAHYNDFSIHTHSPQLKSLFVERSKLLHPESKVEVMLEWIRK